MEAQLQILPLYAYGKNKLNLRQPKFIGEFSLDGSRVFHHDKRNLAFLTVQFNKTRNVCFDLNTGLDQVIRKNVSITSLEKVDNLLKWILNNKYKFYNEFTKQIGFKSLSTDFVCYRGLLTELLCAPYERREGIIIYATKFQDTIYLCSCETPEKKIQRETQTCEQIRMCSWGFKFEQYMTEDKDINLPINENKEYCCVVRSRLTSHSLVYGGETDAADASLYNAQHQDLKAFVEFKTCKLIESTRDEKNFHRYRLRKWWAQSYLVGIPIVICGFRDFSGVVRKLESLKVSEMPLKCVEEWNPTVMMNFLNQFLQWLKNTIRLDNAKSVYKIERLSGDLQFTCTCLGQNSDERFLPDWYIDNIFKK